MKHEFRNLINDAKRLDRHTEETVRELDEMIAIWVANGIDARAIYAALALFHYYYYQLGAERLGRDYMSRLEDQGVKLAEAIKS